MTTSQALRRSIENGHPLVQFYDSDEFLLDVKGPFIGDSLLAGDAAIVIAINWQHDL